MPTNAEIKSFSIEPFTAEKRISGSLPSANYYTKSSDFEYDFTFEISLTLSPRSLVELYKLNKISCDEDLQEYLGGVSDSVAQFAADYFLRKAENNPSFRPESVRRDDLVRNIDFYEDFPEVDVSVLALKSCKLPDYQLYRHLKEKALTSTVQSNIFDSDTNTDIDTSESEDIL